MFLPPFAEPPRNAHPMPTPKFTYGPQPPAPGHAVKEEHIEYGFIGKLQSLKYEYRADIRDRAALERLLRYCARPPFAMERLRKEGA